MLLKTLIANYYGCPVCGHIPMLWDADGSITGSGVPCWYCPVETCGDIEIDNPLYPAPK